MKMAEGQWGGKRTPRNPAPVSAPGALSRRTDGGPQQVNTPMTGMPYGENQDFEEMQSAAPMSASPSAKSPSTRSRQATSGSSKPRVSMFSPTQRPDEPITAGAPFGPGPGPSMGARPQVPTRSVSASLMKAAQFDNDPTISRVAEILARRGL
jgi:hypothetical protein